MELISVNSDSIDRVASLNAVQKYTEVFDRKLGALPGVHHLRIDEAVVPVVMPSRRVPVSVQSSLKTELDRLTDMQVITPVDEPTPWVNQMVATRKKTGEMRICIDPKELNKALLRERYILPIIEDSLHELGESRIFSKADLSSGYWHVKLDDESSLLTTFQTCFGRYRWLCLPFGLCVSSEIFQKKLLEALGGLVGVICIADDVIIHGKNMEDHDQNLEKFLERCQQKGIKLNKQKMELRLNQIAFMGHIVTSDGLQADPEKVKAVSNMSPPKDITELRRFLGMVNYLTKYLSHVTNMTELLRNLTKK